MEKNTYKIKDLKLKNFAKFTDFEVEFNNQLTHLVGVNGAGKTTVGLTAIWACLKGISEKSKDGQLIGERFRFIGGKKESADIQLTLIDTVKNAEIIVRNHITKASNKITFTAPEGYSINQEWLSNLLSVAFLSAKNFTLLDGREQALLLGIDTKSFDKQLESLKEEFTLINREIKNFGELVNPGEVVKVSISDLLKEKEEVDKFNREQDSLNYRMVKLREGKEVLVLEKSKLEENIKLIEAEIMAQERALCNAVIPKDKKDTSGLLSKIQNAEIINTKADEYQRYLVKSKAKELKELELNGNKLKQKEEVTESRLNYIKNFNFGFDGLNVDESGSLLLNDRPLKEPYFSKGEIEVIVAKLYASLNPELRVRFIDDFELLDEQNKIKLLDCLLEQGFQVITAEVGDKATKDNTLLLRECKVAEGKVEKKQTLI